MAFWSKQILKRHHLSIVPRGLKISLLSLRYRTRLTRKGQILNMDCANNIPFPHDVSRVPADENRMGKWTVTANRNTTNVILGRKKQMTMHFDILSDVNGYYIYS